MTGASASAVSDSPVARPFDETQVDAFVQRLRGSYEEVHPQHWKIDWHSLPSPFRWYPDLSRVDLPPMPRAAAGARTKVPRAGKARIGAFLQAAYGLSGVRWHPSGIAKSSPEEPTPVHRNPHYQLRRAVPSGGVTYPAECYLSAAGNADLDAGVYHYDAVRHALALLVPGPPPTGLEPPWGGIRVLLTQPLWKNYFKYGDVAYRLGAMDTGAVVGQFALIARSWGLHLRTTFGVDERRTLESLGLSPEDESAPVMLDITFDDAKSPLAPAKDSSSIRPSRGRIEPPRWFGAAAAPGSRTDIRRMHAACLAANRPGLPVDLPPIELNDLPDLGTVELPKVHRKPLTVGDSWARTSLGDQFRATPIDTNTLATWLSETLLPVDHEEYGDGTESPLRCLLLVRSVTGVPPGAYVANKDGHVLHRLAKGDPGPTVQRSMFANYMNLGQAPVVAVVVGAADPQRGASGPVGYRTQHLLAGVMAQRLAVCAARDGMSAHPVLGFVPNVVNDFAGLSAHGLTALLMVAMGGYRRGLHLENGLNPLATAVSNGGEE